MRDDFGEEVRKSLGNFDGRGRIPVVGDLNARIGEVAVEGIIAEYRVSSVNENGEQFEL